jgi:ubiquinone/menaquinone biosynthesis C-methylase UbiE
VPLTGLKKRVQDFWDSAPCDTRNVRAPEYSRAYFQEIERKRYTIQSHIPEVANFKAHVGKRILDIGGGIGTDSRQFAKNGANVTIVDLSIESLKRAQVGFHAFGLKGHFVVGDAENLPLKSEAFDIVWSHGVLHHTPDTEKAIRMELWRVLQPGGKAIVMLYSKNSFHYWVTIRLMRGAAFQILTWPLGLKLVQLVSGLDRELLEKYRQFALASRDNMQEIINNNTDGLGNPLSKLYTPGEARELFRNFEDVKTRAHFLDRKNIPRVGQLIPDPVAYWLGRAMGFFLYIEAEKPVTGAVRSMN